MPAVSPLNPDIVAPVKSTDPEKLLAPLDEILPPKPAVPCVLSSRTLPLVSYMLPENAVALILLPNET